MLERRGSVGEVQTIVTDNVFTSINNADTRIPGFVNSNNISRSTSTVRHKVSWSR